MNKFFKKLADEHEAINQKRSPAIPVDDMVSQQPESQKALIQRLMEEVDQIAHDTSKEVAANCAQIALDAYQSKNLADRSPNHIARLIKETYGIL